MRSRKKKIEKPGYMHLNPVKRGLVVHPKDWPWSSFSFYNQKGQSWKLYDGHHALVQNCEAMAVGTH